MAGDLPPPPRFRFSYRIATLVLCSCNIVAAIYLLQSFVGPLFSSTSTSSEVFFQTGQAPSRAATYTPEQLHRMKDAVAIWRAAEPLDLIKRVKEIHEEFNGVHGVKEKEVVKGSGGSGLVQRLKELRDSSSKSEQEALEEWRRKKLEEARKRSEAMKAKQEEYLN